MEDIELTVVIPVYNSEDTLPRAIESVLSCRSNIEIIVIDDGSPGDCESVLAKYPAVQLIKHQMNLGLIESRKTGVMAANGKFVAHLDADDWIENQIYDIALQQLHGSKTKVYMFSLFEQGDSLHKERTKQHLLPDNKGVNGLRLLENIALLPNEFIWHLGVNKVMETGFVRDVYAMHTAMPKVNMLEDFLFSCLLFHHGKDESVFCLDSTVGYVYYRSGASMTLDHDAEKAARHVSDLSTIYDYLCVALADIAVVNQAMGVRLNKLLRHWRKHADQDATECSLVNVIKANQQLMNIAKQRIKEKISQLNCAKWIVFGDGEVAAAFKSVLEQQGVNTIEHCCDDLALTQQLEERNETSPVLIGSIGSAEVIFQRLTTKFPQHTFITVSQLQE